MNDTSGALARSVAISIGSQVVAKVLHLGLNVTITLLLVHHFGPTQYGDYVYVIAAAGLLGLLADFGLSKLAVREISRDAASEAAVLGTVVVTRLALGVVAGGAGQLLLLALGASAPVRLATLVASTMFLVEAVLSVLVVFQVRLEQQYEAMVRTAIELVELVLVIVLIVRSASLVAIVAAPVVAGVLGTVLAVVLARRRHGLTMSFDRVRARQLVKEALPVGPAMVIGAIYLRVDIVILAALASSHDVGIYGAAFQPIEYLLLSTALFGSVLFPLLSRYHGVDPARFVTVYRRGTEALLAVTMPIMVVALVLAPSLVTLAYGERYAEAAGPFRVLSACLVLMTINAWQSFVLLAGGRQGVTLAYDAPALALNVVLDLLLIPVLAYNGPGYATLISSVLVTVCSTLAVVRLLGARLDHRRLWRVVQGNAAFAVALAGQLVLGVPWPAAVALSLVLYPLVLQARGVFSLRAVQQLLAAGGGAELAKVA